MEKKSAIRSEVQEPIAITEELWQKAMSLDEASQGLLLDVASLDTIVHTLQTTFPWQKKLFEKMMKFHVEVLRKIAGYLGEYILEEDISKSISVLLVPFPYLIYRLDAPLSSRTGQLFTKLVKVGYSRIGHVRLDLKNSSQDKERVIELFTHLANSKTVEGGLAIVWNVQRNDFYALTKIFARPHTCAASACLTMTNLDLDKREPVAPFYSEHYLWLQGLDIAVDYNSRELLSIVCKRTCRLDCLRVSRGKVKSRKAKLRRMDKEKRAVFIKKLEDEKAELFNVVSTAFVDAFQHNCHLDVILIKDIQFSKQDRRQVLEAIIARKVRMRSVALYNIDLDDDDFRYLFPHLRGDVHSEASYYVCGNKNITGVTQKWLKEELADGSFKLDCYLFMTRTGMSIVEAHDLELHYHLAHANGPHRLQCLEDKDFALVTQK